MNKTKTGTVVSNSRGLFTIQYNDKTQGTALIAGKMRRNKIRIILGDTVEVVQDKYGGNGRIIKRIKK